MRCVLWVLLCACVIFADFSDDKLTLNSSAARLGAGCPTFSAIKGYNSYDFAGSPLGLLEKGNTLLKFETGHRLVNFVLDDDPDSLLYKSNSFALPFVTVGKPGIFYAQFQYIPHSMKVKDNGRQYELPHSPSLPDSVASYKLPLHRFGVALAGGTTNGVFRIGANFDGFYGEEEIAGGDSKRVIMGFRNLGLHIGFQLHDLLRIGFKGSASGYLDTLNDLDNERARNEDRYWSGPIPSIGGNIDFGADNFPVHSNFVFSKASSDFIYVTKVRGIGIREDGDEDPIRGDSLFWKWQTLVLVEKSRFIFRPSFLFGYWRNELQQYEPDDENDLPWKRGRERTDTTWKYSSFNFGIGGGVELKEYGRFHFEYSFKNLKLAYGDAWPDSTDKRSGYPRISAGILGNIHAVPFLNIPRSIEIFARLGYLFQKENDRFNTYRSEEFGLVNTRVSPLSQYHRYLYFDPLFGWVKENTISRFSFGLGGTFLDRMFEGNLFCAFPVRKTGEEKHKGFEFGVDLSYHLRVGSSKEEGQG
ncbi:MAG: hypothetical protein GF401_05800 [Chitinivibrionales bacterium]|nr:hypothetical protein [Chitinivibrionales bacterium]